ncbi:calreticulin-3 isoform X2 [Notamacropus eugenii]|uniref:calreticulin-3 isoform X2 n=1 Tax=Notamacropus eugenii TaxID=9315 RepID=UPI003B685AAE
MPRPLQSSVRSAGCPARGARPLVHGLLGPWHPDIYYDTTTAGAAVMTSSRSFIRSSFHRHRFRPRPQTPARGEAASCRGRISSWQSTKTPGSRLSHPTPHPKRLIEAGVRESWRNRWIPSANDSNFGHFRLSSGKFYGDIQKDKGLQTTENAKFYAISSRFKPFSNKGKTLVIQYTVKHEQKMDCGGGYIKIFPSDLDQKNLNGKSQYYIMFGPDICGFDIKKVHVILFYKNQYHSNKKPIRCKVDGFTHLYTLTLRPDLTYEVKIDTDIIESGNIEEDWNLGELRKMEKSSLKMPKNWDKLAQDDKPSDVPSQGWDKHFLDASANKPSDWNSELDGEWQPSLIQKPKYKNGLKSENMDNSDYKDVWLHQKIENPGYLQDFELSEYENIGVIGLELWQVRSGTIFDNFLITDDENYAAEFGLKTWGRTKGPEKEMDMIQAKEEIKKAREEEEQLMKESIKEKYFQTQPVKDEL